MTEKNMEKGEGILGHEPEESNQKLHSPFSLLWVPFLYFDFST